MFKKRVVQSLSLLSSLFVLGCASRGMHIGNHIVEWHKDYSVSNVAAFYDPNTKELAWAKDPLLQKYIAEKKNQVVPTSPVKRSVASVSSSQELLFKLEGTYEHSGVTARPGYEKAIVIYADQD